MYTERWGIANSASSHTFKRSKSIEFSEGEKDARSERRRIVYIPVVGTCIAKTNQLQIIANIADKRRRNLSPQRIENTFE